jgi:serine/threonine protein kinase
MLATAAGADRRAAHRVESVRKEAGDHAGRYAAAMKQGGLALAEGDRIAGRYLVEGWLGQGAMAVVLRVKHVVTGRHCALKIIQGHLATRPEFIELFVKEAQVGGLIGQNPHIVDVLDAGFDEARGLPYLAMELLEGESLEQRLQTQGPLPIPLARLLFQQLADALDQAHRANVVHRDLKPANLFLTTTHRGEPLLKVLDFGVSKVLEQEAQRTATQIGSPAYAAPEQLGALVRTMAANQHITIVAGVSPATDVWALGLVAQELLTGLPQGYYWGASRGLSLGDIMMSVALEEAVPATERSGDRAALLPRGFDAWFLRCLRKNALERWPTAREALDALDKLLAAPPGEIFDDLTLVLPQTSHPAKAELGAPTPGPTRTVLAPPRPSHPSLPTQHLPEPPPAFERTQFPSASSSGLMATDQPSRAAIDHALQEARPHFSRRVGLAVAVALGLLLLVAVVLVPRTSPNAPEAPTASGAPTATAPATVALTASATATPTASPPEPVKRWVTLDFPTPGAQVILTKSVSAGVENQISVDNSNNEPVRLEVPDQGWRVVARKPGFNDFDEPITFDEVNNEAAMHVKLTASKAQNKATPAEAEPTAIAAAAASKEPGTLSINSIPVSRILLDGKPLGSTPKVGISVSPGSHVVTFLGSDGAKKTVTLTVKSGESKTAATRM